MSNPIWDGQTIDPALLANYGYNETITYGGFSLPRYLSYMLAGLNQIGAELATVATGYVSTSVTSLTVGTGSQSLTVGTNQAFAAGQIVAIYETATPANIMTGFVTSYDTATGALVVNVTDTNGSGTASAWTVALAGIIGPQGDTGATGPTGPTGPQGDAGVVTAAGDGTVSAPGIAWAADTDTGFYRAATGEMRVASDGVDALTLLPASQGEAEAATDNAKLMTALRTKQLLDANVSPSNRTTITATGTLANGDVVVLNSDGTVSVVTGVAEATGTPVVFESASSEHVSVASIGSDKVVIAYRDVGNTSFGTAVVGTVSGTAIAFGTPVVFESAAAVYISVASIGNGKVVIGYTDGGNSGFGTAVVGTVAGTAITFGTPFVFESASSDFVSVASIGSDKVVIAYRDVGNSGFGTAVVGTVAGTAITFGTPFVFESASSDYVSVASIGSDKVVIAYRDSGNTSFGTAVVGTVSGTAITFGTPVVFESANSLYVSVASIGTDKVVIGYTDGGNGSFGAAVVGTVAGTAIAFGTPVVFESAAAVYISVASIGTDKVVIGYRDNGNSNFGTVVVGTVAGTAITFGTPVVFESGNSTFISVASIGSNEVVIGYRDESNTNFGTAAVFQAESTNAADWIGISESAVTDADATVATLGAIVTNQTGLTAGTTYFVELDGSLTTTDTGRKIGKALSATELLIEGDA